ncbi:MAG TPA: hypothetical protein VNA19_06640 [Pyrinomonadaceae bacterium]|jgi:hypothetical protein|nr:hypothetical protein [Pyrinomonadaceae bacterium]
MYPSIRRAPPVLIYALLLSLLPACGVGQRYKEMTAKTTNYPAASDSPTDEINLFEGTALQEAVAMFAEKTGGSIRAISLNVHQDYAVLQAQDASNPARIVSYEYRRGVVSGPTSVEPSGDGGSSALTDRIFSFDEVNLARVPDLMSNAIERVPVADAQPSHMILQRDATREKNLRWLVYVSGADGDGHLTADARGQVLGVNDAREGVNANADDER